ncbi:MAG: hypothetical protein ACJ79O_23555 [Myxococcales bacterium]|jgi:hypothetical protein
MNARELGRRGGRSRSEAKRAAVRRNGLRGGRPRDIERFAQRVRELQEQLGPELPGIDPDDLNLIIDCLLRPVTQRKLFVYPLKGGGYAF